ncbi:Selenocysteine insertion sequence-binding protein 2 [Ophiophagus hannah]|uniref:Selenocysteine insertion sequence-binding protein 2 n=1 Tax=Ophiophagus hannah TaxID=8665 RepID=V8PI49_OPHHA|nr:Selenocysteine insertion sequence-binding protein 2 [Ophiophagus hannah]
MTSERGAGNEGIKLSAEVKPFVPKFAAVTVAWSEPSEACVFPGYYTTCYPYVQEPSVNKYRQLKNNETRLEDQRPNGSDFTGRSTENPPYIALPSRNPIKSDTLTYMIEKKEARIHMFTFCFKLDRPIKVMNGKFNQIPNAEHLPESAFEMTLSDFPKLQDLESNNLLDLQKHAWGPVGSAEGDKLPLTPPGKLAISNITKEQPERRENASNLEETANKKKKKKKKKKPKSCSEVEKLPIQRILVQDPPRIEDVEEFPDLAAAFDRTHKQATESIPCLTPIIEKTKDTLPSKKNRKKSQIPVQLDLGGMLAVLEEKQHAEKLKQSFKPVVLSGKIDHEHLLEQSAVEWMKIILKEREQRKQQHILEQMAIPKKADVVEQNAESVPDDEQFCKAPREEVVKEVAEEPVLLTQSSSEVDLKCTESSGSMQSSIAPSQLKPNFPKIHSRRFRDYCTQVLSKEVDSCVTDLLKELVHFQDRLYQKDPVKAKTKRRVVMGLREVLKHLKLKKLKCVIISPNCEKIQSKGGLDETLHLIIDTACEQNIPFVFALNRKALGHCVNKLVPVSVVGIFSYDGAQRKISLCFVCLFAPLVKIWKQKLEEEYNPYILELEKLSTTDMLPLGVEEPQ